MKTLLEVIKLNKGNIGKIKIGNKIEFVDLGLPSGILWGNCNLRATHIKDPGDYYRWGNIKPCKQGESTEEHYNVSKYYEDDGLTELEPEDDVATQILGDQYKIPEYDDFEELKDNTVQILTEDYNKTGVSGVIIFKAKDRADKGKLKKGKLDDYNESVDTHIFIPASGFMDNDGKLKGENNDIQLWSSSMVDDNQYSKSYAFSMSIDICQFDKKYKSYKCSGRCIRPIKII